MSKRNKGERRGVQLRLRQSRRERANRHTMAMAVKDISEHLYFFGSHAHQLDTIDWSPKLKRLSKRRDQETAIASIISLLSESRAWQLFFFIGIDTGSEVEVFSFLETIKKTNYMTAPEQFAEVIDEYVQKVQSVIDEGGEFKNTQLSPHHKICGFGYYLFYSTDYNLEGHEDEISDSLHDAGVFNTPFDRNNYLRLEHKHFSDMFKRQELRIKD